MNAGFFDMLHDPAYHDAFAVTNRIYVKFGKGAATCLSSEGKVVWSHDEPGPRGRRASSATPGAVHDLPNFNLTWLALHVATAFFGYGFFTVGSALAVSYLMQDFNLKHKRLGHVFDRLPSLETADRAMRRQIKVAFTLFTVSVLMGVRLTHIAEWQTKLLTDPKIVTVLLTWVLYAGLLVFCAYSHRHGKKIAQVTVLGLILVLFSFLGIHALADSAHDFATPNTAQEEPDE